MQAFDDHGECAGEDVFSLSENSDQQECRLQSRPCMFILNAPDQKFPVFTDETQEAQSRRLELSQDQKP